MNSVEFSKATAKGKRFKAIFKLDGKRVKTIQFGDINAKGRTYIDGATKQTRDAYIARHKVREDWSVPDNRGSLSKYIIWETPSLKENIRLFKKKFNLS